jgi:hypothetical protein
VLIAHRKVERQKQRNNCKSDHHKSGKALSAAAQKTSDFICNWDKQMNARRNTAVSSDFGETFLWVACFLLLDHNAALGKSDRYNWVCRFAACLRKYAASGGEKHEQDL